MASFSGEADDVANRKLGYGGRFGGWRLRGVKRSEEMPDNDDRGQDDGDDPAGA